MICEMKIFCDTHHTNTDIYMLSYIFVQIDVCDCVHMVCMCIGK